MLIVCYLFINHTFPKICIILDSVLDQKLCLPIGTNLMTVGSSTFLGAIGKFIGVFIDGSKKTIIIWSFFLNALCLTLCITTSSVGIFILARSLQGFFAGIQASILFGLIGTLPDCKSGFRNFTTISSVVCITVGIFLYFLNPINIIWGLILISLFSGVLFWRITPFNDKKFSLKSIDWLVIGRLSKNKDFIIKTSFLGFFLGCVFLCISQQKRIVLEIFNLKIDGLSNLLPSLSYFAAGVTSFIQSFHSFYMFNILNFICLWCVFLGLATKSIYIFSAGILIPFGCFSIINPIVMEEVTMISSNRFVSSAFATCFRSFVTSLVMSLFPLLIPKVFLMETMIICCFISGVFYSFVYGKA